MQGLVLLRKTILFFLLAFLPVFLMDQLTKSWALQNLPHTPIVVIEGIFELKIRRNYGSAFGLFSLDPAWYVLIAIVVTVVFLWFLKRRSDNPRGLLAGGSGLFLAGVWGNQLDRLHYGYVVDFLEPSFWPTFNVADLGITIGLILVVWDFWRREYYSEEREDTGL